MSRAVAVLIRNNNFRIYRMIYPKIPLAQSIIEICKSRGIKNIVISPGSRNAPLTIGFVNNPYFNCYSIADERCAAFFGMGMAQQNHEPVALVCTSGSALLNYYPAVAEAFYSQIPLLIISADRPHDKIDIGDGQTIRQENVYQNHILYSANLTEMASPGNDMEIHDAITIAKRKKGPVHINAPFEEPLYETIPEATVVPLVVADDVVRDSITADALRSYVSQWNTAKKKLILVGVNPPNVLELELLKQLAADGSVVVMTETTSNIHHPDFVTNIDTIITPFTIADFEAFRPDILLTFGGMVVSKRIKAFLRKYRPQLHWHVDLLRAYDTFGSLTKHFEVSPETFFSAFLPLTIPVASDYDEKMQKIRELRSIKHEEYLQKTPFSDFKVFENAIPSLPKNSQLQLSNSSTIRYAQLIAIDSTIEVYCNRGTSGIDGSTSTAIGAAVASGRQTVLMTGDIGFLYDSNALWNNYIPASFRIIVLNNGGGGIFRILPGHQETPVFNTFFETSHHYSAAHLAKMFGFTYVTAHDENELKAQLEGFYEPGDAPAILEVFTPMLENDAILLRYFKELV